MPSMQIRSQSSLLLSRGAKVEEDIGDAARLANASTDMYQVFLNHGWDVNSRDVRGRPFVQYHRLPAQLLLFRRNWPLLSA